MTKIGTPFLKALLDNRGFSACGDPGFLLDRLIEHGLAGRASHSPDLPAALHIKCQAVYQQQKHLNLIYLNLLSSISKEASQRNIRVTVLKGAALLGSLYPDIGERSMADLDLLVRPEEAAAWDGLLLDLGLSLKVERRWAANRFKRNYVSQIAGAPVVVELHTRLFYDAQDNWETETRRDFQALRREEEFLYLSGHLGYQHTFLKLSWLVDLLLLWRQQGPEMDMDRLLRLALQHRKVSSLYIVFKILSEILEEPELAHYFVLPAWKVRLIEKTVTDEFLLSPYGSTLRYLLVKHLVKDSMTEAMRYDLGWILQRTGVVRQLG